MTNAIPTAAVIMAGGKGERFWPESRQNRPKQFLALTGDGETMLQKAYRRVAPIADAENIYVVTNRAYRETVREQLPGLREENLLFEPAGRNTAPCIALAAAAILRKMPDAVMLVLPSDHLVRHEEICADVLRHAAKTAREGQNLVTVGITPTCPETGYGYIAFSRTQQAPQGVYKVREFKEKPDLETARHYVESGKYLWNSGMFAWKASTYFEMMERFMPHNFEIAKKLRDAPDFERAVEELFPQMESISVDYGILEHAEDIYTIPGSFGWDDVGSWPALRRVAKTDENGNYVSGDAAVIDSRGCVLRGGRRLLAAVGLENIIVVDTEDALLVCDGAHAQRVKEITALLKDKGRTELL